MDNSHRFSFVERECRFVTGLECSNSSCFCVQSSNVKQKLVTFGGCLCECKKGFKQIFRSIHKEEQEINGVAKIIRKFVHVIFVLLLPSLFFVYRQRSKISLKIS